MKQSARLAALVFLLLALCTVAPAQEIIKERSTQEITKQQAAQEADVQTPGAQKTPQMPAAQPWPPNGRLYDNEAYPGEQTELDICLENQAPGYASLIKLYAANGDLVRSLFAGQTDETASTLMIYTLIPGGDYLLKIGTGQIWYGPEASFGREKGSYCTLALEEGTTQITLDAGYVYSLYIDASQEIEGAEDVESEMIPYEDF